MRRIGAACLAGALVVGISTSGCTPVRHDADFTPTLAWTTCPSDVEVTFVSEHQCGYLTVLQDRAKPTGPTVRLLVVKATPVGTGLRSGVVTSFGTDIGDPNPISGNISTGATRLERVVLQMESRGSGRHSVPSLRCPETDGLAAQDISRPTGDPQLRSAFLSAVAACASRLRTAGVDPAQYGQAAIAADVEDLRVAAKLPSWSVVNSYGSQSRALFSYLQTYPDKVEAAYLDSPRFADEDDLTEGVIGTRNALRALFHTCAAQPSCQQKHPSLSSAWTSALSRLRDHPIRTATAAGPVLVDDGKLLRIARFALGGDGIENLQQLPDIIDEAARGKASPALISLVAGDQLFCAGYRPLCVTQTDFSLGSFLTAFCAEQVPFIDRPALDRLIGADHAFHSVFGNSPYLAACAMWEVTPAEQPVALDTATPVLFMVGAFDSFSDSRRSLAEAKRQSSGWAVVDRRTTHNVLGFSDCMITLRNRWTWEPTAPPDETLCADRRPISLDE